MEGWDPRFSLTREIISTTRSDHLVIIQAVGPRLLEQEIIQLSISAACVHQFAQIASPSLNLTGIECLLWLKLVELTMMCLNEHTTGTLYSLTLFRATLFLLQLYQISCFMDLILKCKALQPIVIVAVS